MNTRLQVEHPVTEWVTGLDLVRWQIRVAEGEKLPFLEAARAARPRHRGAHLRRGPGAATSCRRPGSISYLRVPGGPNVRDDSGVYAGYTVPNFYDPMISKLSRVGADARARPSRGCSARWPSTW